MHHRKRLMIAGSLVLALAAGWMVLKTRHDDESGAIPTTAHELHKHGGSRSSPPALPSKSTGVANVKREASPETPVITDPKKLEKILGDIHTAAITYDASHLPEIDPYLLHPNPEIRKAARDAMITLGDPAAGPLLRTASARAPSPHEAVALLEAADYVELPSAKIKLTKKIKSTPPQKQ